MKAGQVQFTSTGKGGKTEKPSPIGQAKQRPKKLLVLCSVGQSFQTTPLPAKPLPPETTQYAHKETIRVRDSDLDPSQFDPDTGKYFQRPLAPARLQRAAADAWVR